MTSSLEVCGPPSNVFDKRFLKATASPLVAGTKTSPREAFLALRKAEVALSNVSRSSEPTLCSESKK